MSKKTDIIPGKTLPDAKKTAKKINIRTSAERKKYAKTGHPIKFNHYLISTGRFSHKARYGNVYKFDIVKK